MNPILSVVIPSLGQLDNLKKIVNSIKAQEIPKDQLEVLIVINGHLDSRNVAQIKQWASAEVSYLKIFFLSTKVVNLARNHGLKNAKSDVVIFFDDDCVIENKQFLLKHLQFHQSHPEVFAYGGGYTLSHKPAFWDRIYNYLQMKWLYSGIIDDASSLVVTRVLLGGNFSIKLKLAVAQELEFDEFIIYGGSEFEFFKQARIKNLTLVLNSLNVYHNTSENLFSVTRKLYKQGRGKAHIDLKHGPSDLNSIEAVQNSLPFLQGMAMLYFNYVFWSGYYVFNGNIFKLIPHVLNDLIGSFNKSRYKVISKISRQLKTKKDQGDRF